MAHHIETQPLRDTVTVVFFMIWVQLIGSMASLWLPAIAPEAAAALGIDASLIGLQVVVVYLGGMITSLFAGGLVARLGAWRVSQVSLGLFALAHLIISSGALPLMALGSFIIGFGYGLINPPAAHKYQYWVCDEAQPTLDAFVAQAKETKGSWWPDWRGWLETIDSRTVAVKGARQPGKGRLKAIEDAPGRYVKGD